MPAACEKLVGRPIKIEHDGADVGIIERCFVHDKNLYIQFHVHDEQAQQSIRDGHLRSLSVGVGVNFATEEVEGVTYNKGVNQIWLQEVSLVKEPDMKGADILAFTDFQNGEKIGYIRPDLLVNKSPMATEIPPALEDVLKKWNLETKEQLDGILEQYKTQTAELQKLKAKAQQDEELAKAKAMEAAQQTIEALTKTLAADPVKTMIYDYMQDCPKDEITGALAQAVQNEDLHPIVRVVASAATKMYKMSQANADLMKEKEALAAAKQALEEKMKHQSTELKHEDRFPPTRAIQEKIAQIFSQDPPVKTLPMPAAAPAATLTASAEAPAPVDHKRAWIEAQLDFAKRTGNTTAGLVGDASKLPRFMR